MADYTRIKRDRQMKSNWDKNKIDVSKIENEKPIFDKEKFNELMEYAKKLEEKKKEK